MKKEKQKPHKHKQGNTFRHKSFNERVAEISVDSRRHLTDGLSWKPTGNECFFYGSFVRWLDLNRTQHFLDFQHDVHGKIQTYALLVHHKDYIIEALKHHLSVANSLALEPLLDLLTNLARDLPVKDLYSHLSDFFMIFREKLLPSADPEILEWTFSCLSHLFKILQKPMTEDFQKTFGMIVPLLEDSQKEYIVRFASESFAFLVRRYRDTNGIMEFLLSYSIAHPELAIGIGTLLFESMKNVNHTLHPVVEKLLPALLNLLCDVKYSSKSVDDALASMLDGLKAHLSPATSKVFWDVFLKYCDFSSGSVYHLFFILAEWTGYKQQILVSEPEKVLSCFLSSLSNEKICDPSISELAVRIARDFAISAHSQFGVQDLRRLARLVFSGCLSMEYKLEFAESVFDLPLYEVVILPQLLRLAFDGTMDHAENVLHCLVAVVLRRDQAQFDTCNILEWKPLHFDIEALDATSTQSVSMAVVMFIKTLLSDVDKLTPETKWSRLWSLAVILPHFRTLMNMDILKTAMDIAKRSVEILQADPIEKSIAGMATQTLQAAVIAVSFLDSNLLSFFSANDMYLLMRSCPSEPCLLSVVELWLKSHIHNCQVDVQVLFHSWLPVMKRNLRNPSHASRLYTLRIISLLVSGENQQRLVQACLKAESISPSVYDYRDKLRFLRMLDYSQLHTGNNDNDSIEMALLYLFGCLKIGFQLIWKEVRQLIGSYGTRLTDKSLWPIVATELEQVSLDAESVVETTTKKALDTSPLVDLMVSQSADFSKDDSIPLGAHKYRIQLWQALGEMVNVIEPRNRVFVELFLRFMKNECAPTLFIDLPDDLYADQPDSTRISRRSVHEVEETLCSFLELFSKFRNPAALYQEPVLRRWMSELVTYRLPKVQQLALKFHFNYNYVYVEPYKEHLMKLLEEKEMWNTLVEIEFGAANPVIAEEHRGQLVPLIIRILFGRMQSKSKSRNSEKGAPRGRKEAIIRSLANCTPAEFSFFLDLVLRPCRKAFEGDYSTLLRNTMDLGLEKVFNLKQLDGVLHTLFVVVDELRTGLDHSIHRILKTVLVILAISQSKRKRNLETSASGENELPKVGILKKLRKESYRCLSKIGSIFPLTKFCSDEQSQILNTAVWPEIENITQDGVSNPIPLMRLIFVWSKNLSYLPMLDARQDGSEKTPLGTCITLLEPSIKARASCAKMAVEIIHNIVCPDTSDESISPELFSQGKALIGQQTGPILRFLGNKLTKFTAKKNQKTSPLSEFELDVAEAISEFQLDAKDAGHLFTLMVPVLTNSEFKKESSLLRIMAVIKKQAAVVPGKDLTRHIRPIISMLSKNLGRDVRTSISEILKAMTVRIDSPEYELLADTAIPLMAWNTRHLEEPDYDIRVNAYKLAKSQIAEASENKQNVDFGLLVLHMAAYDITKSTDIASSSLRSMGGLCTVEIVRVYSEMDGAPIILSALLPIIKLGLKHPVDTVRNEFITILAAIVRYNSGHPIFGALSILRSPSDPELDVFENLRHIQKHRVGRAFHRLTTLCQNAEIPISSMVQFFLPLASAYLCNDQYLGDKSQGLVNSVINLIGAVAGKFPWSKYEPMLKHFLNVLCRKPIYYKQMIRVVIAVVDNFHFDLSSAGPSKDKQVAGATDDVDIDDMDLEAGTHSQSTPIVNKISESEKPPQITQAQADKIYRSLTQFILPNLYKVMTEKASGEDSHKLNANIAQDEKQDILRAPVALAIVKLLQKLPQRILRREIHGVFLRIARLLQSRLASVRKAARETLSEIMMSIGPSYLNTLIKQLRGVLMRGYQIHVMVHCVHMVLAKLLPMLKSGDIDHALDELIKLCHEELFGQLAEEKKEPKAVRNIAESEGEKIKSYETYAILARFVSPRMLVQLISPLKEKAEETQSHDVAEKLEKALRQIHSGLVNNEKLSEADLLLFAHALYDRSTGIFSTSSVGDSRPKSDNLPDSADSYIIPKEPGRLGTAPSTSRKTNDHLMQSFGLKILLSCLKNGLLRHDQEQHLAMLDPFVLILKECLKSIHIDVMTHALRCLTWMFKFKLPSMEESMGHILKILFVKLRNFSGPGSAIGENAKFVVALYKALSSFVRDVTSSQLSNDNLKALLVYIQEDLYEGSKQVLAFTLLKAILSRHLLSDDLRSIMFDLASRSIQAEQESLRVQCQQLVQLFLTTYNPDKIDLKSFVELYRDNMEYGVEHGRLVCISTLSDLLSKLGKGFVLKQGLSFFHLFAARLSDESPICRHKAADAISNLLTKTESSDDVTKQIWKWCHRWMTDNEVAIKRIGYQTCSLIARHEKSNFSSRLTNVLPVIAKDLTADKLGFSEEAIREYDSLLISVLTLLEIVEQTCGDLLWEKTQTRKKKVLKIFDAVKDLLLHEHDWVRIKSLEVYLAVLKAQPPKDLISHLIFEPDPLSKLSAVVTVLLHQLKSYSNREEYYQLWSDCMIHIVQVVTTLPISDVSEDADLLEIKMDDDDLPLEIKPDEDDLSTLKPRKPKKKLSLRYVVSGVCWEAIYEALHNPRQTQKRFQVVKWIHRLCGVTDRVTFSSVLRTVVGVIYRCLNEPSALSDEKLKLLAEEVSAVVEAHVGREEYADAMKLAVTQASNKKAARKRLHAVTAILNPEKTARKKMKKQQTKKEAKKRKFRDMDLGLKTKRVRTKE